MISWNSTERAAFKIHAERTARTPLLAPQKSQFWNPIWVFNQKLPCRHTRVIISQEQKAIIIHSYAPPFKKSFGIDYVKKNGKRGADSTIIHGNTNT